MSHNVHKGHKGVTENEIARQLLDDAFAVHSKLGPGLLEAVYGSRPSLRTEKRGLTAERQKPMPIMYDNIQFDEAFRSDVVGERKSHCRIEICGGTASGACETASDATASKRPEARSSH